MRIDRLLTVSLLGVVAHLAFAAQPRPYTKAQFDQLAREGKPVVVDVAASWCPTCRAQKPIIESLADQPAFKGVAVLQVDFDQDQQALKDFKVSSQSTLIAFKGGKETGRSVGDTTRPGIESLFKKAAQ